MERFRRREADMELAIAGDGGLAFCPLSRLQLKSRLGDGEVGEIAVIAVERQRQLVPLTRPGRCQERERGRAVDGELGCCDYRGCTAVAELSAGVSAAFVIGGKPTRIVSLESSAADVSRPTPFAVVATRAGAIVEGLIEIDIPGLIVARHIVDAEVKVDGSIGILLDIGDGRIEEFAAVVVLIVQRGTRIGGVGEAVELAVGIAIAHDISIVVPFKVIDGVHLVGLIAVVSCHNMQTLVVVADFLIGESGGVCAVDEIAAP